MGSTAISQNQPFSSENISKALLIIGIGVFTYSGVSQAVNKVAKKLFEKNSSKPQLAAIITSSVVVTVVVMRALFWESSKVQLHFVVILLGYVVERVAFYIWGKADTSKTVFPQYMWDLVAMEVKNEENESMIGHEEAINHITTLLHGNRKTNAFLLGLPGVGKTAIAKNFAYKIGKKLLSNHSFFQQMRVIEIKIGTLLADLGWTETFEDQVAKIVKIGTKYPQFVFFIDRDDTLGAGGVRLNYHITLLKHLLPYTENGRIKVLATLTWEEYKLYILPEDALTRFVNLVHVKSPSAKKCFNMLRCRYIKINQKEDLKVSDQAIAAAIFFSGSISSHQYPDKAIDLIEHALSRVDLEKPMDEEVESLSESSDDETVSGSSDNESTSESSADERLPRASIVIDVHQIVKSALALYQWNDSPESLVQQYKQYINDHPNHFPGLLSGDDLWVSQLRGPLLLEDRE
jgi:ATP-dependent Clp protease ATP-binding subunit ClpA